MLSCLALGGPREGPRQGWYLRAPPGYCALKSELRALLSRHGGNGNCKNQRPLVLSLNPFVSMNFFCVLLNVSQMTTRDSHLHPPSLLCCFSIPSSHPAL